ncbi:MAG: acyl carrier protein [Candidatus Aminicenantes bacterium]|jgi:acyl carrier protein
MEEQAIKQEILNILASKDFMSLQIDVENIHDHTSLINDVALDSIQILELIVAIENKFKFSINTNELSIDIFDRFSDLVNYVQVNVNHS